MRLNARIGVVHIGGDQVSVALVKTGGKLPLVLGFQSERILGALPEIDPAELQAQAEIVELVLHAPSDLHFEQVVLESLKLAAFPVQVHAPIAARQGTGRSDHTSQRSAHATPACQGSGPSGARFPYVYQGGFE